MIFLYKADASAGTVASAIEKDGLKGLKDLPNKLRVETDGDDLPPLEEDTDFPQKSTNDSSGFDAGK
eukprot:TRINITY_DN15434_c0_g1_i1.p3 TRINITY_DN15434_c0_g1~~TRINITY_DN15434_c0_g1_i1.p3  ORF type:complete len:67 (-),score=20.17 TRINITY_DN15434_c0_g1_i1:526-726(-)